MLLPKLRTPAGRSFTWLDCCHDSPGGFQHCLIDSPLVSCELAIGREGAGDVRAVAVIFSSHIKQAEKETQGKKWQFSSKEIVEHDGSLNCSALNKIYILVDHQYNHCLNTVLSKAGWQSLGISWQKGICIPHGLNGHSLWAVLVRMGELRQHRKEDKKYMKNPFQALQFQFLGILLRRKNMFFFLS